MWLVGQGDASPVRHFAYCGTTEEYGVYYNILTFFIVWIGSDFWEFAYHYSGHRFACMWNWHRHHHVFFNPTPFAVIADEFGDQFMRASPLLLFPLIMPTNLDILILVFTLLFYGTGTYHHCGHEVPWPNAHTGFFNTAYHHYLHHSISVKQKPYHCGFMFQVWDQLAGSVYTGTCFCVKCSQAKGLRTREQFAEVVVPDYSLLFRPSFWLTKNMLAVLTGKSASDTNEELTLKEGMLGNVSALTPPVSCNTVSKGVAAVAAQAVAAS